MHKILSPSFWFTLFLNTLLTMFMIYLIKSLTSKVNIPVVSDMAQEV